MLFENQQEVVAPARYHRVSNPRDAGLSFKHWPGAVHLHVVLRNDAIVTGLSWFARKKLSHSGTEANLKSSTQFPIKLAGWLARRQAG